MHTVHISKTKWLELATNSKVRPNGGQSNKCVITLEREKKKTYICPILVPGGRAFFWSASKIATSDRAQRRKSAIHGPPVILHMLRIKSNWFWSQTIVLTKPFKTGMSLDLARSRDSWCWPKGAGTLRTRMILLLPREVDTIIPMTSMFPDKDIGLYLGRLKRPQGGRIAASSPQIPPTNTMSFKCGSIN